MTRNPPPLPLTVATGASAFLSAGRSAGLEVCFANPGTTELALVRAFDLVPGWRVVPGLFEGVCTGAADGYARILGRPALTLTHLGPGFANGIANLHNAKRARAPIVNLIGDHATWHLPFDAPLASDIDSLAAPVSGWIARVSAADRAAEIACEAVAQSLKGQISTVVFPADLQAAATMATGRTQVQAWTRPASNAVERVARRLAGRRILLLIGGDALGERGLRAAQRIAQHTGAALYCETFPARIERGHALPAPERFPYFPEPAFAAVEKAELVVVAGAAEPVTYFGYAGFPSRIVPSEKLATLASPTEAAADALQALADAIGCPESDVRRERSLRVPASANLDALAAARSIAAWLPEGAIVSVEGGTCGYPFFTASAASAWHTVLTNTGGAIGQGLPVALGAAIAAPGRRVVCVQSDGSAQYTLQALWTMARESLAVTVLIAANRRYAVLQNELRRDGMERIDGVAARLTSLDDPPLEWTSLARGYGLPSAAVRTCEELDRALDASVASQGPFLIEMVLD